jgi:hypothetical protein
MDDEGVCRESAGSVKAEHTVGWGPHRVPFPAEHNSALAAERPADKRPESGKQKSRPAENYLRSGRGPLVSPRAADGCIARVIRESVRATPTSPAALPLR